MLPESSSSHPVGLEPIKQLVNYTPDIVLPVDATSIEDIVDVAFITTLDTGIAKHATTVIWDSKNKKLFCRSYGQAAAFLLIRKIATGQFVAPIELNLASHPQGLWATLEYSSEYEAMVMFAGAGLKSCLSLEGIMTVLAEREQKSLTLSALATYMYYAAERNLHVSDISVTIAPLGASNELIVAVSEAGCSDKQLADDVASLCVEQMHTPVPTVTNTPSTAVQEEKVDTRSWRFYNPCFVCKLDASQVVALSLVEEGLKTDVAEGINLVGCGIRVVVEPGVDDKRPSAVLSIAYKGSLQEYGQVYEELVAELQIIKNRACFSVQDTLGLDYFNKNYLKFHRQYSVTELMLYAKYPEKDLSDKVKSSVFLERTSYLQDYDATWLTQLSLQSPMLQEVYRRIRDYQVNSHNYYSEVGCEFMLLLEDLVEFGKKHDIGHVDEWHKWKELQAIVIAQTNRLLLIDPLTDPEILVNSAKLRIGIAEQKELDIVSDAPSFWRRRRESLGGLALLLIAAVVLYFTWGKSTKKQDAFIGVESFLALVALLGIGVVGGQEWYLSEARKLCPRTLEETAQYLSERLKKQSGELSSIASVAWVSPASSPRKDRPELPAMDFKPIIKKQLQKEREAGEREKAQKEMEEKLAARRAARAARAKAKAEAKAKAKEQNVPAKFTSSAANYAVTSPQDVAQDQQPPIEQYMELSPKAPQPIQQTNNVSAMPPVHPSPINRHADSKRELWPPTLNRYLHGFEAQELKQRQEDMLRHNMDDLVREVGEVLRDLQPYFKTMQNNASATEANEIKPLSDKMKISQKMFNKLKQDFFGSEAHVAYEQRLNAKPENERETIPTLEMVFDMREKEGYGDWYSNGFYQVTQTNNLGVVDENKQPSDNPRQSM